ncbi:uncharacterized protein DSM5745_11382 [Aspergillus mulundensis]|uniref:Uncharacterized protein n=1 Tax=Aspergillus mulundensis TaxID=1810919 RepID=A0A3D8Q8V0_9EURO|nr:hypothetical protein DSM5745_11382 [Aspergillus mulundensis]RDW57864.1 hypothetical protein DSM5745_11382 [Aspergillus mulundensis]
MSTPTNLTVLQEAHKHWEGLELNAIPELHGDPSDNTFHAALLARSLALSVAATGCNTFSVEIAFWIPTSTWRVALTAKEPIASELGETWMDEVAAKFTTHAQIKSVSVERRSIDDPPFDDAEDWVKDMGPDGKELWAHATWFTCFRGIPFLLKRDGHTIWRDMNAFIDLRAHDSSVKGVYLGSKRLAPGRTDHRSYLLKVLSFMTDIKPPAATTSPGKQVRLGRAPGAGKLPSINEVPCDDLYSALAKGIGELELEKLERQPPREVKVRFAEGTKRE